jgi:hypothetical protein
MEWVRKASDLKSFMGYVVVCAPSSFPKEDFLSEAEQMTLEKAFVEIRRGISMLDPRKITSENLPAIQSLLDRAYAAYTLGEVVKGAHLLQDVEDMIYGS